MAGREEQGGAADLAAEFSEGDDGAGEGDGTDQDAEVDLDVVDDFFRSAEWVGCIEKCAEPYKHGGKADEAVQHGDELGHGGHFYACGENGANDRTDDDDGGDDMEVADGGVKEGGGHGKNHSGDAVEVSSPGFFLVAQSTEAEDEQDAGDDVTGGGDSFGHEIGNG